MSRLFDKPFYWLVLIEIHYYDTITLRHKETKVFLHSHIERYPLTYADGRVSSQGNEIARYSGEEYAQNDD